MKNGYYLIGEVSKITGIPKDTLQFYNKIGLIAPDHINPENKYKYYSRWDLWRLDIISMCQKLGMPLDKIKQLLKYKDNEKVMKILLDYRSEALRLSEYYQRVADDITWYEHEDEQIREARENGEIRIVEMDEEQVIAGAEWSGEEYYHAKLQEVSHKGMKAMDSIRRKYGYVLDRSAAENGIVQKNRAYLKVRDIDFSLVVPENIMIIPGGKYAVWVMNINQEKADFSDLFRWVEEHGYQAGNIYAEEVGLQLFHYIDSYVCEIHVQLLDNKG